MTQQPTEITLTATRPPLSVTALRGDGAPSVQSGYGGWTVVDRPRRKGLTQWTGIAPLRLAVPLLLDGLADARSVERDCETLEALARRSAGAPRPPILRVRGAVPHASLAWVVDTDGLAWGDALYDLGGFRVRQAVTVTLLEYVAPDQVDVDNDAGAPSPAKARSYTVKAGDTLSRIAATRLGDYKRWQELATLNGIRDPDAIKPGQTIRLPA